MLWLHAKCAFLAMRYFKTVAEDVMKKTFQNQNHEFCRAFSLTDRKP